MALSFVGAAQAESGSDNQTSLTATSSLNIQAGDTLFCVVAWEVDGLTTFHVQKDSGTPTNLFTFDTGDKDVTTDPNVGAMGYVLSASADATATFKLTIDSGDVGYPRFTVLQFRGLTSPAKNVSKLALGSATTVTTGNFTTTVSDAIVCAFEANDHGFGTDAEYINGVLKDETYRDVAGNLSVWYRIVSGTFTGTAQATTTAGTWICGAMAFAEGGGGAGAVTAVTAEAAADAPAPEVQAITVGSITSTVTL